jgi:septal ring-binding cell division protein DamX
MPNLDAVFTSDLAGIPENSSRNKASQGASLSTDSVMQDRLSSEITQAALESDFAGTTLKVEAEISELAVALVETVARPAVVEVIDAPITAVALQAVLPVIEVETQEVEVQTEPQAVAVTLVDAIASPALTEVIEVPVTVLEAPEGLTVAEVAMPKAEIQTEAPDVADTLIEEITRPVVAAVIDTPERVVELPEVLAAVTPIEVDVEVTTLAVQAEAPELAVAVVDAATSPIAAAVIDAPMRVVKPEVLAAVAEVEMTTPEIQTDALERPGLAAEPAMASVQAEVQDIAKIVSPKVEKIATEIVVPASEPFPAGTTLAEVYTDHVQRSEQLPAQLQTLGPKGALPMPAVASTRSAQRYAVQPTPVQLNRSANSAFAQAARLAQAAPLIAAVADAAKLDSIAVSATGLDYASMAPAATSGDGTYDYFMDLPSDDFAIQLKAEKNLAALRTFAATVDLEDPLVLKTQLMKRPLYVLVLDTFNDIQLASDAKRSWMAQYNNGIEPWIRTVGSLQKTMQPIGPMD